MDNGLMILPRSDAEAASIAIVEGVFSLRSLNPWRSYRPMDLWFFRNDGQRFKPVAIRMLDEPSAHRVILTLPRPVETLIEVQDFRGRPIEGAQVRVHLPVQILDERQGGVLSDAQGVARVLHSASDVPPRVSVSASGYASKSILASDKPTVVRLGRILAGGYIFDRARDPMARRVTLPDTTGMSNIPNMSDSRLLLEELERGLNLSDTEFVDWLVLHEETEWRDPRPGVLHLTDAAGTTVSYEIPVVHVLEGVQPVRPDLENCGVLMRTYVELGPASAFLAQPPDSIKLRFVPPGASVVSPDNPFSPDPGRNALGFRVVAAGRLYEFFLPQGEYEVAAHGGGFERHLQRNPNPLSAKCSTTLHGSPTSPCLLQLHPDERYVTIRLADQAGLTLDLAAELVSQTDEDPAFFARPGGWPRGRFVRPGYYQLMIASNSGLGLSRMDPPLSWPAPVSAEGCWDIPVDLASQGPRLLDSVRWQQP